jgi:hypothetical protein
MVVRHTRVVVSESTAQALGLPLSLAVVRDAEVVR